MRYMIEMESSARGFELTGDQRFLEPFPECQVTVACRASMPCAKLTPTIPQRIAGFSDIRDLDDNWIHWAEQEIATHAHKGLRKTS